VKTLEGTVLEESTICSLYDFDGSTMDFQLAPTTQEDLFEHGVVAYIPKDFELKDHEKLGGLSRAAQKLEEEESDYDFDDEMDDEPDQILDGLNAADVDEENVGGFY
jgi:hypothetical protein